jgi:hypothetical protein
MSMKPSVKHRVVLNAEERHYLRELLASGVAPTRKLTRARILLKTDDSQGQGWTDNRICLALDVSLHLIERTRRDFVTEGLMGALERQRPQRIYERALDGAAEAHLIALACSVPPAGQ